MDEDTPFPKTLGALVHLRGPAPRGWEPWQAGAYYAARGFAIVPLMGKSPAVFGSDWWERRITIPSEVVKVMAANSYTNIGICMGCGLFAIDVDHPDVLPEEVRLELVGSAINVTRPGRQHHLFAHPDGEPPSGSTNGFPAEGWGEVRGKGGQIVGWGPHPLSDDFYQFDPDQEFSLPSTKLWNWLTPATDRRKQANSAEVADFLARYTLTEIHGVRSLDNIITKGDAMVAPRSEGLHEAMLKLAPWAFREAAEGRFPAKMAHDRLLRWWNAHWHLRASQGGDGRIAPDDLEFDRIVMWAVAQVDQEEPPVSPVPPDGSAPADQPEVLAEPDEEPPPLVGAFLWRGAEDDALHIEPIEFSVVGVWPLPTYGVTAGSQKSLKSTLATGRAVALAAGVPVFGQFVVPEPRPVLYLVGEGGRGPWLRSFQRWKEFYDLPYGSLEMFRYTTNTAPLNSPVFMVSVLDAMERLEKIAGKPGLVVLDPKYAYAAHDVDTRMLGEQGAALARLSGPIVEAGWTLDVIDHFKKTGHENTLAQITGAGVAEWADSWTLVSHRIAPDVMGGRFMLDVSFGSRQWGGMEWEIDVEVGHFNLETAEHEGEFDIRVRPAQHGPEHSEETRKLTALQTVGMRVRSTLREVGKPLSRTAIRDLTEGKNETIDLAVEMGLETGSLMEVEAITTRKDGKPMKFLGIIENPNMLGRDDDL